MTDFTLINSNEIDTTEINKNIDRLVILINGNETDYWENSKKEKKPSIFKIINDTLNELDIKPLSKNTYVQIDKISLSNLDNRLPNSKLINSLLQSYLNYHEINNGNIISTFITFNINEKIKNFEKLKLLRTSISNNILNNSDKIVPSSKLTSDFLNEISKHENSIREIDIHYIGNKIDDNSNKVNDYERIISSIITKVDLISDIHDINHSISLNNLIDPDIISNNILNTSTDTLPSSNITHNFYNTTVDKSQIKNNINLSPNVTDLPSTKYIQNLIDSGKIQNWEKSQNNLLGKVIKIIGYRENLDTEFPLFKEMNGQSLKQEDYPNFVNKYKRDHFTTRSLFQSIVFKNELYVIGGYDGINYFNDIWKSSDGITWKKVTVSGTHFDGRSSFQALVFNDKLYVIGGIGGAVINYLNDIWETSDGINWYQVQIIGNHFTARSSFQAIVFNTKVYVIGGHDSVGFLNDIWESSDMINWTKVSVVGTYFNPRDSFESVVFNDYESPINKVYVIGGHDLVGVLNDIWESADMINWTQLSVVGTHFTARSLFQSKVFNYKLYVIGGHDSVGFLNDIWETSNGINWTQVSVVGTHFLSRAKFQSTVYNNKLYVIGGTITDGISNEVWESSNTTNWSLRDNYNYHFDGRSSFQALVFNNNIYVIGGSDESRKNDIWKSSDGVSWDQVTVSGTHFSARIEFQAFVFNNNIYVIGGYDGSRKNDIWKSSDGITWDQVTVSGTHFTARYSFQAFVFNNNIYVIGGLDGSRKNDIWKSSDGVSWDQVTVSGTHFDTRYSFQAFVFNNNIYVIGGSDGSRKNDIWKSSDGITWNQVTVSGTHFDGRSSFQALVFNNNIYVIGGSDGSRKNDIWKSSDGITWDQVTVSGTHFSARIEFQTFVFNNNIYVIGGYDGSRKNDIWKSSDGVSWDEGDATDIHGRKTGIYIEKIGTNFILENKEKENEKYLIKVL